MSSTLDKFDLTDRLRGSGVWIGDRGQSKLVSRERWWRDAELVASIGHALDDLFSDVDVTVVLGPQSSGYLLGPLVARSRGVGFVAVSKDPRPLADSDTWLTTSSPPDYRDRTLELGFPAALLRESDRALVVDDWVDTGGTALGVKRLIEAAGATLVGTAAVIDGLREHGIRRTLKLRALLNARDL